MPDEPFYRMGTKRSILLELLKSMDVDGNPITSVGHITDCKTMRTNGFCYHRQSTMFAKKNQTHVLRSEQVCQHFYSAIEDVGDIHPPGRRLEYVRGWALTTNSGRVGEVILIFPVWTVGEKSLTKIGMLQKPPS